MREDLLERIRESGKPLSRLVNEAVEMYFSEEEKSSHARRARELLEQLELEP